MQSEILRKYLTKTHISLTLCTEDKKNILLFGVFLTDATDHSETIRFFSVGLRHIKDTVYIYVH